MTRPKIPWGTILLESFFVVLAIVLALAANEWREERAQAQRGRAALEAILEELAANREEADASARYHGDLLSRLRGLAARGDGLSAIREMFPEGFVRPARLLDDAWTAASGSGAMEFIPYDRVLLASRLYTLQERYQEQTVTVGQEIYRRLFAGGTSGVLEDWRNLESIHSSLAFRECELTREIREALPVLAEGLEGAVPADPGPLPAVCRSFGG